MKDTLSLLTSAKRRLRKVADREEVEITDRILLLEVCCTVQAIVERVEKAKSCEKSIAI